MNIEEQIQYLDTQIAFHEGEVLKYKSVKNTISGLVAPAIESIPALIAANESLTIEAAKVPSLIKDKKELEVRLKVYEPDLPSPDAKPII